jgi:hypothetical protein
VTQRTIVKLQVRLPEALHRRLTLFAARESRSLNGAILYLLARAVAGAPDEQCREIEGLLPKLRDQQDRQARLP